MKPNDTKVSPPAWATRLLRWYCAPHLREEVEGDLQEEFNFQVTQVGAAKARLDYVRNVFGFIKPFAIKRKKSQTYSNTMIRSYFKIGWRNLLRNKGYSLINIGGLTLGMSVAILIGLWIGDELSFNRYHKNYETVAQLARMEGSNGSIHIAENSNNFPIPLADELRNNYGNLFQHVALASANTEHLISFEEKKFSRPGMYVEPDFTEIFTLKLIAGSYLNFRDPNTILLTESLARSLFGSEEAEGKILLLDGKQSIKVAGVFEDLPANARFSDVSFFCPLSLLVNSNSSVKDNLNNWGDSSFEIFVRTTSGVLMPSVSNLIKKAYWAKIEGSRPKIAGYELSIFLHPMEDWHLRSEWKNGVQAGGRIQQVWLFGVIGAFVLLLACINFMNLSTARSEKRGKEVGIRKAVGSLRNQLINQFLSESFLIVGMAFVASLAIVSLTMNWFNQLSSKEISLPFSNAMFWILSAIFIIITAFVSGSYPALYLSSFQPVKVLKGSFRSGGLGAIPRKVMVILQFTVSIVLMVGTIVVYRQIQHAQNRPVGYNREGLIRITINTPDLYGKYDVLQKELLSSNGAVGFAQSSSATTQNNYFDDNFQWEGKDLNRHQMAFALTAVTYDFGKTVGWQFAEGRDFSRTFSTDGSSIILNEASVDYMGLIDPVGKTVRFNNNTLTVIGVIKDMLAESPYEPVRPSVYFLANDIGPFITIRLNPELSTNDAIKKIESVFKKYNPASPFDYNFVDEEYGKKFAAEQRIGTLANLFALLAIIISCLGIFGLASFVAEQRTKEIGVRKILGASLINVWGLLSKEFVVLVGIALIIAAPVAWYFMEQWLQKYEYRTTISWWIIPASGVTAVVITLLTVSFQAIKAALTNPVRSLRSE
jgi:putative ABC transport system permease protein